eukprot:c267_g1_i1.p1 GENE.c267_g1_i1~~c267_g1_i1.p1  ORF type:complete len:300 (-),score=49.58 c267_g1_i1:257-1156(-)
MGERQYTKEMKAEQTTLGHTRGFFPWQSSNPFLHENPTTSSPMRKTLSTDNLNNCYPTDSVTRRSIFSAVLLGFIVLGLLLQFVAHIDLPDMPPGKYFAVFSVLPLNVCGIILWMCLFGISRYLSPYRLAIASLSASWIIMLVWLVCAFICSILAAYFAQKTQLWPNITNNMSDHNKNRFKPHSFTELKNAQRASVGSAALSFTIFVLWAVVARYRMQSYRIIRALADLDSVQFGADGTASNSNDTTIIPTSLSLTGRVEDLQNRSLEMSQVWVEMNVQQIRDDAEMVVGEGDRVPLII